MNSEITAMIKMKPKDAIKLDYIELKVKEIQEKDVLPEDGLYRYLYQPGELEGGQQRRAIDMIWSWNTFRLDKIIQDEGERVLYYLRDDPKRSFVREEMMLIPEETQLHTFIKFVINNTGSCSHHISDTHCTYLDKL